MSNPSERSPKIEITRATNEELGTFVQQAGQFFIDAQNQAMQDLGFDNDPRELEAVSVKIGPTELGQFDTLRDSDSAEVIFTPPAYNEELPLDDPHQPAQPATIVALTTSRVAEGQKPTVRALQITSGINLQPAHVWNVPGVHLTGAAQGNVESFYAGHGSFHDAGDEQNMEDLYKQMQGGPDTVVAKTELQEWLGLLEGVVEPARLSFSAAEHRPEPTLDDFIELIR